ncbi:hypothetical protein PSEUDO8BK_40396 [Pseudomonas sp. 8BK]|nr:hypothetical protein PSEUDO8BK_40396 [Pseudomonas sp. 8BK]
MPNAGEVSTHFSAPTKNLSMRHASSIEAVLYREALCHAALEQGLD